MFDKIRKLLDLEIPVTVIPGCNKTDCILYSEWEIGNEIPVAWKLPQACNKNKLKEAYSFSNCAVCVHFKGFDLYRQKNK